MARRVAQNAVTVILPILPASRLGLEIHLRMIGDDVMANTQLRFDSTPSTHFARWVVLKSISGESGARLLFSAWFDGELEDYARELSKNLGSGLEEIWRHCRGYAPGTALNPDALEVFFREFALAPTRLTPQISLCAFPGATARRIREAIRAREAFEDDLDRLSGSGPAGGPPPPGASSGAGTAGSNGPGFSSWFFRRLIDWLVGVRRGASEGNSVVTTSTPDREAEDRVVQNSMTIVSEIKPGIRAWLVLRLALLIGQFNKPSPSGQHSGVSTIHFARWIVIDGGRNLLFESNYDGSWESYIDDFGDLAHIGMDLIWGNCTGFPKGGSLDIDAFKKVIRDHQHPAVVFYSAYPATTVTNIFNDQIIENDRSSAGRGRALELVKSGYYPLT